MPRPLRQSIESGCYHITIRGINRQDIFLDDEDRTHFLDIVSICKDITGMKLYNYALMSDHIHLQVAAGNESISTTMQRIQVRFVRWYNKKYDRVGHLFQNRFDSRVITNERGLLAVWHYIMRNPANAGMESYPGERYFWTGYGDYFPAKAPASSGYYGELTDIELIQDLVGSEEKLMHLLMAEGKRLVEAIAENGEMDIFGQETPCLDSTAGGSDPNLANHMSRCSCLSDETARAIMQELSGCATSYEYQKLPMNHRKQYFVPMSRRGISVRQMNRITGCDRRTITRVLNGEP